MLAFASRTAERRVTCMWLSRLGAFNVPRVFALGNKPCARVNALLWRGTRLSWQSGYRLLCMCTRANAAGAIPNRPETAKSSN